MAQGSDMRHGDPAAAPSCIQRTAAMLVLQGCHMRAGSKFRSAHHSVGVLHSSALYSFENFQIVLSAVFPTEKRGCPIVAHPDDVAQFSGDWLQISAGPPLRSRLCICKRCNSSQDL